MPTLAQRGFPDAKTYLKSDGRLATLGIACQFGILFTDIATTAASFKSTVHLRRISIFSACYLGLAVLLASSIAASAPFIRSISIERRRGPYRKCPLVGNGVASVWGGPSDRGFFIFYSRFGQNRLLVKLPDRSQRATSGTPPRCLTQEGRLSIAPTPKTPWSH